MSVQTHGAHCVHLADFAELDTAARRARTAMGDVIRDLADARHAISHGADCAADLVDQIAARLGRAAAALSTALDS